MDPFDLNTPYGDKLVRKNKFRKNKVDDQADQIFEKNVSEKKELVPLNKALDTFHQDKNFINDSNEKTNEKVPKENIQKVTNINENQFPLLPEKDNPNIKMNSDEKINENIPSENGKEYGLPALPHAMKVSEIQEKLIEQKSMDIVKSPVKANRPKIIIILSITIAVLAILVLVLLILTIGNYKKNITLNIK